MKAILFWTAYTTDGTLSFSSSLGLQKMCSCKVAFSLMRLAVSLGEETWKTTDEWTKKKFLVNNETIVICMFCMTWWITWWIVLSEGFIHETRLTSLLVCHEGVSPFVWLQWQGNLWQRQSAVRFRLEMAYIFFSESPPITLWNFSWRNPVYT